MEITDFCFLGHAVLGPRIIAKIEQKGVTNKERITGTDANRVYYVGKTKDGYQVCGDGKDSAFGKHILSSRDNITVDEFQHFLQEFANVFIPEKEKKRKYEVMSDNKVQRIIEMVKCGCTHTEMVNELHIDSKKLSNKLCYLRKKGLIPSVNDSKIERMAKEVHTEPKSEPKPEPKKAEVEIGDNELFSIPEIAKKASELAINEMNIKINSSVMLAAAMLVMGVDFTDEQIAFKAVNISDIIFNKINLDVWLEK